MKRGMNIVVVLALLLVPAARLSAQSLFGTLTGVVSDPSGAVVPNASVKLINEQSSSTRDTVTDSAGYYSFASVAIGNFTYKLTVEAKGFETFEALSLQLLGGEKRNLNVTLKVGSTAQTVEVTGAVTSMVPVDSGEKSQTLTDKELDNFIQVGSDAAEYIKIMPGFAIQNGTTNKANYTGEIIGINANGGAGSQSPLNNAYTYNGLPGNSLDIVGDGAHVADPGCDCDTPVNPNSDFLSEFKTLTSNFSAENQKGPIVVSSVTKSGANQFHGSAFFSARNFALNANDALNNAEGVGKPQSKFYYPGGSIGGPIKKDKLFFFTGYEYFFQTLDTGLIRATVPTQAMLQGDFSPASLDAIGDANANYITASGSPVGQLNAAAIARFGGTTIPTSAMDPNMLNLMKLYPAPNVNPNSTGGFNWADDVTFSQPNQQWVTRVDYNVSDNTKLFVRYNLQRETQPFPVGLWWTQSDQVPYPTDIVGKNRSDSVSASLTHVFNPTMTNEFVFGYTYIGFPNVFQNPAKVNRSSVGFNYSTISKNGITQIPSFGGSGGNSEAALVFNPAGFEVGGPAAGLFADKWLPTVSDTFAKVIKTHTVKAGFFYEWIKNSQPDNNNANGYMQYMSTLVTPYNPLTTGDSYADGVLGILNSYNESTFDRLNDESWNDIEFFGQDDWKVTKRLTINYGLRMSHLGPWIDRVGYGFPIFNSSQFSPSCAAEYCGFEWHKINPSVPLGGFPTRALFYAPRVGAAYDLFGNGKTVLRGGYGRYYFHAGQATTGLDASAGVKTYSLGPNVPISQTSTQTEPLLASSLDSINLAASATSPAAVDGSDNKAPYTDSYSFTVSRQLPWSSLLEVAYVGNRTRDIESTGNGGTAGFATENINLVPIGAMLASNNGGANPNNLVANNYRPYLGYSDLDIVTNNAWDNYNGLEVTWVRSKGRYTVNMNYTYSKSMGIVGFYSQYNLASNYGVMANNRPQLFNAAYSIVLPNPTKNRWAGGFANGWQLSGVTQLESGPNLTAEQGQNFGINPNGAIIPGSTSAQNPSGVAISDLSILGTPDINLSPILTCNPRSNLGPHQYINGNCFALPTQVGQNGGTILPPVYGPGFFDWDMALFKNFKILESKTLQFRVDGYNWLNHPLWSFNGANLGLSYDPTTYQQNSPFFGTTTTKQGHRIVQMEVKFTF